MIALKTKSPKRKKTEDPNQMSLFDNLVDELFQFMDKIEQGTDSDWVSVYKAASDKIETKKAQEAAERARQIEEERQRKHNEHISKITCMDLPLDWNNAFSADERATGVFAESISDGLILSLVNIGLVDIEYIAQVSRYSYKEVIETLKGSIYQNPDKWDECFYKGWETADEYLSGNLIRKHKVASRANKKYTGYFSDNLRAIEAVIPKPVRSEDIYVTLGSPWVPPDMIDDFILSLFPQAQKHHSDYYDPKTKYEPVTGTWTIVNKHRFSSMFDSLYTYGTTRIPALNIIEKTLNMKVPQVFDKVVSKNTASGEKRIINKDETFTVQEKQKLLIKMFQDWIWKDSRRKERLETIYDEQFGCVRQRNFNGSFLNTPGISPDITLYPYQKNAIARILFTPNTLLAHDVGAGKTYIMVVAGMELRRMGISKKNVYVVPNNIVGQWENIFRQIYPNANLLIVEPKNFKPSKRYSVLKNIRDLDYDAVVIAYSSFELIPMSREFHLAEVNKELDLVTKALIDSSTCTRLKNKKQALEKALSEIELALLSSIPSICLDDLKINTLFVDEAHHFKNISIDTKIDKILGINKSGSAKCNEMLHKVRSVQQSNNGRGVVFATGTPITNSITDIFVMQSYLQYGELKFLDLHLFDNWAANFGEKTTEFEVDVDTSAFRMATRFSKFHNLPELTNLIAQIADFHKAGESDELPEFDGYDDRLVSKSIELSDYLTEISDRAEAIRDGLVSRTDDNMLKLTTDGRKAALDMRLTDPVISFSIDSKVYRCMENVLNIYNATADSRLTQLIFCDISTPKAGFNLYDEMKDLLVYYGVPDDQIAFIHDHETIKSRAKLFTKIRNGEVRVLLGSTFKLGIGVNVQKKLVAIHHLDVPWRPADMVQREGRILRQGNENKRIQIFRYITDGSFDAYSWQLLESKQRFICQLLSGSVMERSASDIDDVVLSYAEVKALAIGNPLIKERVETVNEIRRISALQRRHVANHVALKEELFALPGKIMHTQELIKKAELDEVHFNKHSVEIKDMIGHREIGMEILNALKNNVMREEKTELLQYQGFSIVLPDNMLEEKRFVWIEGNGRYYCETGDSDIGCINRIDNKLKGFADFIKKQHSEIQNMKQRNVDIEVELKNESSYPDEIRRLQDKLTKIDKKLGVEEE